MNAAKLLNSVEMKTFVGGSVHAVFLESTNVTENIMLMTEPVPIVAFIVGTGRPYGPQYTISLVEISRRRDIMTLNDIEGISKGKRRRASLEQKTVHIGKFVAPSGWSGFG